MFNLKTSQGHTHLPHEQIPTHQEEEIYHSPHQKYNNFQNNLTCINNLTIALTFVFIIGLLYHLITCIPPNLTRMQYHDLYTNTNAQLIEQRLPKILWIYTQNQRDSEPMENDLYYNYFADFAAKAKYQVRQVSSLTAYDHLSTSTIEQITSTMSKRTVDETVHSFLKLALLYQKGGIMIEPGTVFLSDNFKWIQYMFDKYSQSFQTNGCQPENSHFFLHRSNDNFKNMILATVPRSPFIKQVYDLLTEVVVSQQMKSLHNVQEKYRIEGLSWDKKHRVYNFGDSLNNFINHVLKKNMNATTKKCSVGMQQPTTDMTLFVQKTDIPSPFEILFLKNGLQRLVYSKGLTNVKAVQAIGGLNQQNVINSLARFALGKYDRQSIIDTLVHRVLVAPINKQIFMEDLPARQIELCLIIMEGLTNQQMKYTSTLFNKQIYSKWKLIMPAQDIKNAPKFQDKRILVMQQKSTKVHIIEKAAAKYCPPKGYAVLLNYNQTFPNQNAFLHIANGVQKRDIVGAYIPLSINGKYKNIIQGYIYEFYRITDGIVNPDMDQLKHMINHFRVFSVETFKTIPQFAMRDWNGKYHKDRLIFLMDFHDLIHRYFANSLELFTIKRNAHIWNVPRSINILNDQALLSIREQQQVNLQQLKVTRTRVSSRSVKIILQDLHKYKIPFSKMAAFNPGDDFIPVEQKKGPQIIPKVIHQVWLGSKIPPAKQYFIQKTKKIYPSYELKIWREHNITRQVFPTTYDIIQNLLDFNKRSPYNKLATVTDIMRHEILYKEGGLWKDAGMNMLRAIPDAFLKYKLILPTDRLYQYRYLQGMCFFGNMPKFENMLRINNYRNLNRMRIFSSDPFNIAGPVDFRQLVVGQEQFDPEFILLPYQTFYPGQMGQHPQDDLCTTQRIQDKQKFEIVESGWYLLPDCELKYPYAFAIEHNNYGSSWVGPKQLQFLF